MTSRTDRWDPVGASSALGDPSVRSTLEKSNGWMSGAAYAARLRREHAVPDDVVRAVENLGKNVNLIELPGIPVSIFNSSGGSLGCHRLVAVSLPSGTAARRINLPFGNGEAELCQTRMSGGEIGGQPVLIGEEGTFESDQYLETDVSVTPFGASSVGPSCSVSVRYTLVLAAGSAFCRDSVDCGAIIHAAEGFAQKRSSGADAAALGSNVPEDIANRLHAAYDRMLQTDGAAENFEAIPNFHDYISLGYSSFGDNSILFPFRIWTGDIYMARLGHGFRGANESPGYVFAAYGLNGDRMTPAAGVSIAPNRGPITSVVVK